MIHLIIHFLDIWQQYNSVNSILEFVLKYICFTVVYVCLHIYLYKHEKIKIKN